MDQKYFKEYWGKGNADVVDEVCAGNFIIDHPMYGPGRGKRATNTMLLEFCGEQALIALQ